MQAGPRQSNPVENGQTYWEYLDNIHRFVWKLQRVFDAKMEGLPALRKGSEVELSEYTGGPLDALAKLFMDALRTDDPEKQNQLIEEWNKEIKFINSVLKGQ